MVIARKNKNADAYLCAYIVASEEIEKFMIRSDLQKRLPDYMIPAFIMQIEQIPVTRNGKVNIAALPEVSVHSEKEYEPARNEMEEYAVTVFQEVLGVGKLGISDDFFELGGDSIKAIRVVSKLREYQIQVSIKDIMQYRTVKELCMHLNNRRNDTQCEQGEVTGLVPMHPTQSQFFKWNLEKPQYFTQTMVLKAKEQFDEQILRQTLEALVIHHDMLRAVYRAEKQEILSVDESSLFDLSVFEVSDTESISEVIRETGNYLLNRIDLEHGPMVKTVLYHTKEGDYFMFGIHHLVVDGVSWRILLEDFETVYRMISLNQPVKLPMKTDSYLEWVNVLNEYAKTTEAQDEVKYWKAISEKAQGISVVLDKRERKHVRNHRMVALDQATTEQLLHQAGNAYDSEINDLLLSALVKAMNDVRRQGTVCVELEGHGRESYKERLLDRTVGWFTSIYPVILEYDDNIGTLITETKKTLRVIPHHGAMYGILKETNHLPEVEPEISFNYLGQLDNESKKDGIFEMSGYTVDSIAKENSFGCRIAMNGGISGGCIAFEIDYDTQIDEKMIEQFGDSYITSLKQIINHCVESNSKAHKTILGRTEKPEIEAFDMIPDNTIDEANYQDTNFYETICSYGTRNQSKITKEVTPTMMQNYFFESEPEDICEIKVRVSREHSNLEDIMRAMRTIIKEQACFRMKFDDKSHKFVEYEMDEEFVLPYFDGEEQKEEYFDQLLHIVGQRYEAFGKEKLLSRVFIVSGVEDILIYIAIHHCIWDKMSTQILVSELKEKLEHKSTDLEYTSTKEERMSIRKDEVVDEAFFESFVDCTESFNQNIKEHNFSGKIICQEAYTDDIREKLENKPVAWIMEQCYRKSFVKMESKNIPFMIVYHGRTKNDYRSLGMYLDLLPAIYDTETGEITGGMEFVKDYVRNAYGTRCAELYNQGFKIPMLNMRILFGDTDQERIVEVTPKETKVQSITENEINNWAITFDVNNGAIYYSIPWMEE